MIWEFLKVEEKPTGCRLKAKKERPIPLLFEKSGTLQLAQFKDNNG
jgi:hypothetical protein